MGDMAVAGAAEYGDTTAQLGISLGHFYYATAALLVLCAVMHLVLALRATPESDQFHRSPPSRTMTEAPPSTATPPRSSAFPLAISTTRPRRCSCCAP
ncbi:hypothetical protein [Mycobacterium tuberculosis]|uniref:hypothetical protein n=1 Tax=Mycobacterium tuberculosis TaxID=1773 RepID=UPI00272B78FC|nr:hypothetical protein [Mycobacterium tuberculosis]